MATETKSTFVNWLAASGIIVLLGIGTGAFSLYKGSIDLQRSNAEQRKSEEAEITARATERAVELVEIDRIREAAYEGQAFSECWPTSTCPGLEALPIDNTQNERLDRLESQTLGIFDALKTICQGLRDRDGPGKDPAERWPDCAELNL